MNQHSSAPPSGGLHDVRTATNLLAGICRTFAVSVEVFLHSRIGSRYLGLQAGAAIMLIPFWSMFWPGEDVRPLLWFLFAYLAMCFWARMGTGLRTVRGARDHSRYTGRPRVLWLFPRMDELRVKRGLEPILVFFAGVLIAGASLPLGSYLMVAAFALMVSVYMTDAYGQARAVDLYDASIEQRDVADRFRHMRGEVLDFERNRR